MAIRVRVTERDFKVLLGCYENVFLSFKQIKKRYFKAKAPATVYCRLSLLMRAGYMQSVSVGGILDEKSSVTVVYQVTRKGYELLLKKFPEKTEDEVFLNRINLSQVYHDYLLSEAVWRLRSVKRDLLFLNTKVFQTRNGTQGKRPDAILVDLKSQRRCAVELELTRKSDRRYRDIVTDYRLSSEFDVVLYVTKSECLSEKIREVIRGKTPHGFTAKSTGKFYFVTVKELLENDSFAVANGKEAIFKTICNQNSEKEALCVL